MNDVFDPKSLKGKERDTAMFLDWYQGLSQSDIARKYGVTRSRIKAIKKSRNWEKSVSRIVDAQYEKVGHVWKKLSLSITSIIEQDINRLAKTMKDNPQSSLLPEDRTHLRLMLDSLNKITRLVEDKPTDIIANSGVVEHRVILHPQATHWGVIPPPDDVKVVKAEDVKEVIDDAEYEVVDDDID